MAAISREIVDTKTVGINSNLVCILLIVRGMKNFWAVFRYDFFENGGHFLVL